jgi:hypothetical protein
MGQRRKNKNRAEGTRRAAGGGPSAARDADAAPHGRRAGEPQSDCGAPSAPLRSLAALQEFDEPFDLLREQAGIEAFRHERPVERGHAGNAVAGHGDK